MNAPAVEDLAWNVVHECAGVDGLLRAAAGSALYPHVWTRDVGVASFGILAASRGESDIALVIQSLERIAKHRSELGGMPLKVDVARDEPVLENSSHVDSSLWFAIATRSVAHVAGADRVASLVEPAIAGVRAAMHLDTNGDRLLETPEASDWADMMPHRHTVLFPNLLYAEALDAVASFTSEAESDEWSARARVVRERIGAVFAVRSLVDAQSASASLERVAALNPEWGLTGQYATRYGDFPFLLPYVAFRAVGTHCDVVGNCLAVLTGVLEGGEADQMLDYLRDVGVASPAPSKTIYPPIEPGHPDWRDHFLWRNLNVPHHYQNGGSWPFAGALHVAALVKIGRMEEARARFAELVHACAPNGEPVFPEWQHGRTGAPMGERKQLWSAAGVLFAGKCVREARVPLFGGAPA